MATDCQKGRTSRITRPVLEQIRKERRMVKELSTSRQHTAELEEIRAGYRRRTKALLKVEEEERRSIAGEIHDDLGQPLTALKIYLSWLATRISRNQGPVLEKVEQMLGLIDSITSALKRISVELRPGVLDDLGLAAAIEWQAAYFRERTGIECALDVEPENITLDQQTATAIFHVLHKILTNIPDQASATGIRIRLRRRAHKLHLKVIDNGGGTPEEQTLNRRSSGLMEIGEYARLFGGEVNIRRNPGGGTTVAVSIPLDQEETAYDKDARRG